MLPRQPLLIALLPSSLPLGPTSSCISLTCEEGEMSGRVNQEKKWDIKWPGFGEVQDHVVGHGDGRKDGVGRWNPQGPWPCYDPRKWPGDLWNPSPELTPLFWDHLRGTKKEHAACCF